MATKAAAASSPSPPPLPSSLPAATSGPTAPTDARRTSNWSLWPIKTSSSSPSSPSSIKQQQVAQAQRQTQTQAQTQTQTHHGDFRSSTSGSPPSPFWAGHSDSSPPSTPPDVEPRTDLGPSSSLLKSPSSRNDIFSAPSPQMAPAPRRIPPSPISTATSATMTTTPSKVTPSKNSSFFGSGSLSPSPASASAAMQSHQLRAAPDAAYMSSDERPAYGRSSTEERERERARIRQSNSEIDFRLCPAKSYLLGEGRHCNVYLGSYRIKSQGEWQLCAVKRLHADRQSQLLGLDEAFALRRLGAHPHVIKLISVRDEVALAAPASPNSDKDDGRSLGKGLPSTLASHLRSSSDTQSHVDVAPPVVPREREDPVSHRRLASQPLDRATQRAVHAMQPPVVLVASPDGSELHSSDFNVSLRPSENHTDPPRLLILLELLPYSLSSFARKNPLLVDWFQWKKWAVQLSETVAWLHAKGCVHADLKPENILLTTDLDVKLCDFNSALFPHPSIPLTDGLGLGTPAYSAPELMRGAANRETGFSFGVDVWSLGAILYTLATGKEAFSRARSMIDLLYRKRMFFESEENDRIARQSVAEGWGNVSSNAGSQPVSRSGSLRKKNSTKRHASGASDESSKYQPFAQPALRREPSCESVSSVASGLLRSASGGRQTSAEAIDTLLEPSTPVGLLVPPGSKKEQTSSAPQNLGHHRASSLGKSHASTLQPHAPRSLRATAVARPTVLRRTTSYGGAESEESSSPDPTNTSQQQPQQQQRQQQQQQQDAMGGRDASLSAHSGHRREKSDDSITSSAFGSPVSSPKTSAGLRLAVTQALAATHQQQQLSRQAGSEGQETEEEEGDDEEEEEDRAPYRDGSTALILPGGGRLPDEARDLLERMLSTDPRRRPSAQECHRLFTKIGL